MYESTKKSAILVFDDGLVSATNTKKNSPKFTSIFEATHGLQFEFLFENLNSVKLYIRDFLVNK